MLRGVIECAPRIRERRTDLSGELEAWIFRTIYFDLHALWIGCNAIHDS